MQEKRHYLKCLVVMAPGRRLEVLLGRAPIARSSGSNENLLHRRLRDHPDLLSTEIEELVDHGLESLTITGRQNAVVHASSLLLEKTLQCGKNGVTRRVSLSVGEKVAE